MYVSMEASPVSVPETMRSGPLEIRVEDQVAEVDGVALRLTRHELGLLIALARREGAVIPREMLAERAWSRPLTHGDRSVDVYVRRLRMKLAAAAPDWEFIHTHFAFGYRFAARRATSGSTD
jgi:DNA-binding response OmpR family regulator